MTADHGLTCDCFDCDVKYDRRIKETKVAAILGCSQFTLQKARWRGTPPEFEKQGRAVVYRARSIRAFADARRRSSTSATAPKVAVETASSTFTLTIPAGIDIIDEKKWIRQNSAAMAEMLRYARMVPVNTSRQIHWSPVT